MEEKENEEQEEAPVAQEQTIPSDEAVKTAFSTMAEDYVSQTRLYNMLKNPVLRFEESEGEKVVTLVVINDSQKKWVEERLLRTFEKDLRRILATGRLRMLVDVTPDAAVEKKPYMPGEQAMDLISKNEEVRLLVEQMKLDTK